MELREANENAAARPDFGAERAAALAEGRKRLSAESRRTIEAAEARRADQFADLRAEVARAVGADTRVSITRAPGAPVFLYRAIDEATGKVVHEWPRLEALSLAQAARAAAIANVAPKAIDASV